MLRAHLAGYAASVIPTATAPAQIPDALGEMLSSRLPRRRGCLGQGTLSDAQIIIIARTK